MKMDICTERWAYKVPFRIARGVEVALDVVVVTLEDIDGHIGRGEAAGVDYHGETVASMCEQLDGVRTHVEKGMARSRLQEHLPPGGARNALDCALWDLQTKALGISIWTLLGMHAPHPITTCFTLGIDTDEATAAAAIQARNLPWLKLKVDAERHLEVVRLVRRHCPAAKLIVDANQSWSVDLLRRLAPELVALNVALIEQPLPMGADEPLGTYRGPIPLAADESCVDRASLGAVAQRYQVVNIKLDKCGGLTEALALSAAAQKVGLRIMVGCMAGTSLAMAPGMVVAQQASFVDLDGPLLHALDRNPAIEYRNGVMALPPPQLWG